MRGLSLATPWSMCLALAALGFAFLGARPVHAQDGGQVRSETTGRDSAPVTDLESIRQDLLSTIDVFDRMGSRRGLTEATEAAKEARRRVRRMSADDLRSFEIVARELQELRDLSSSFEYEWDKPRLIRDRDDGGIHPVTSETGACCDTTNGTCSDEATCEISVCSNDDTIVCSKKVCSNDGSIECEIDVDCGLDDSTGEPFACVDFDCGSGNSCIPTSCSSDADCTTPTTSIDQGECLAGMENADCQGEVIFHGSQLCSEITCDKDNNPSDGSFPNAGNFGTACTSTRADTGLVRGLLIGVQAGRVVAFVANRICAQDAVGFNGELACIATDEVFLAAESVFNHVLRCVDAVDMREIEAGYKRAGHIHGELQTAQSSATGTSLLVNKNLLKEARTRIVDLIEKMGDTIAAALHDAGKKIQALFLAQQEAQNEEVRAFRAYTMRILIEDDLGMPYSQNREARFQLPRSFVCPDPLPPISEPFVPCGGLEDVAEVTTDTIDNMIAAGMPVFDAPGFLDKANHEFDLGNYKSAYVLYKTAYGLATGLEPPPLGACCTGGEACKDTLLSIQCTGEDDVWYEGLFCVELNPPCQPPPPPAGSRGGTSPSTGGLP